jgi:hypothetical protein
MYKSSLLIILLGLLTLASSPVLSSENPAVFLIDAKGKVDYSPDGKQWSVVNRNKFLFEGWRVKTGADGSCKLLSHDSNSLDSIRSDTEVEILSNGLRLISGAEPENGNSTSIIGFLKRKFANVQKYTSTRRSAPSEGPRLITAPDITLSAAYPDMVWENLGPEYAYQLHVGDKIYDVPASESEVIRFTLPSMPPGDKEYCVNVLYKGEIIYAPEKRNTLRWLSEEEVKKLRSQEGQLRNISADNGFLMGALLDETGMKVAAMDQFRKFLAENPDANEMRPFLIKVLSDLKLEKMKNAELSVYQAR